jgi:hypothetical protein
MNHTLTLPDEIHGQLQFEFEAGYTVGYAAGVRDERQRIANGHAELDRSWINQAVRTEEDRIAERAAAMEHHADLLAERLIERYGRRYRGTYHGGPVDWETGAPLRHLRAVA